MQDFQVRNQQIAEYSALTQLATFLIVQRNSNKGFKLELQEGTINTLEGGKAIVTGDLLVKAAIYLFNLDVATLNLETQGDELLSAFIVVKDFDRLERLISLNINFTI